MGSRVLHRLVASALPAVLTRRGVNSVAMSSGSVKSKIYGSCRLGAAERPRSVFEETPEEKTQQRLVWVGSAIAPPTRPP